MKLDLDLEEMLDGFTRDGMKRFVKKLLSASEAEEKELLSQLDKRVASAEKESNDLADLKEEKRGKPSPVSMDDEPASKRSA
jgi:hypothetical protein